MPKQKTHKGTAKRVKITGTGRVKRHRAGGRHLLSNKSGKRKRNINRTVMQDDAQGVTLRKLVRGS